MKMNILIVDDDPMYIELVHDVVTQSGHNAIAAGDGVSALEQLRAHDVQLIISDLEMPVMGGMTFYMHVRGTAEHARTPFWFLSGTTRIELLDAVSRLTDAQLITKARLVAALPSMLDEVSRSA